LRQELARVERREPRLEDDVVLEVKYPLKVLERHVEQQPDAARQRLQEPEMRDRRRELDMAHALAPDLRQRHLHAALLADDALVLHALVLAAQALVVLDRTEDARAEQAVALRLEGPVVDRLGLLDLAIRPGLDPFRTRDGDADTVESLDLADLPEDVHDLLVHRLFSFCGVCRPEIRVTGGTGDRSPAPRRSACGPPVPASCMFDSIDN